MNFLKKLLIFFFFNNFFRLIDGNEELRSCYWLLKIIEGINCINSKDFSYALKILRENLKFFENNEDLRKFSSARDLADYLLVLLMMSNGRNELLRVFLKIKISYFQKNFFLNLLKCSSLSKKNRIR